MSESVATVRNDVPGDPPNPRGKPQPPTVAHVHVWTPVGLTKERRQFFDGITNPWATVTLAIRSCECGAIRKTEVSRAY